ncbi:MAG: sulfurtransferase [Flavobacterium sp.]|nr:MAG: sulfurtransferase [Flavobacterium sp.]
MDDILPPIIQPEELVLAKAENIILIDASAGPEAYSNYREAHLDRAIFIGTENLAAKPNDPAIGGRHPLPDLRDFSNFLGNIGIAPDSHVIIYDDKNGSNASARLWWMLRGVGHLNVQVLNGGLPAAVKAGYAVSDAVSKINTLSPYPVSGWQLPVASMGDVRKASIEGGTIIDVRDKARYDGITEPIDLIAGHIPGAINIPFSTNLDDNGFFLSPAVLHEKYKKYITSSDNAIVHCGSGITACHTLLAIDYAGLPIPKLYVGSWSEWSRNEITAVRQ